MTRFRGLPRSFTFHRNNNENNKKTSTKGGLFIIGAPIVFAIHCKNGGITLLARPLFLPFIAKTAGLLRFRSVLLFRSALPHRHTAVCLSIVVELTSCEFFSHSVVSIIKNLHKGRSFYYWRARRDSNSQPSDP